ncbi:MAG: chromosomal replication initiator protein DnaA [Rhodospirillales bacterium]|nr:chromosomal replication initiator protein DnaA [Rhodospirillales bacterium]
MTDHAPPPARDGQDAWQKVRARLLAEVGQATFASWLAPLTLVDVDGDQVTLGVGTRFLRDWIASHYAHRITALWGEELSGIQNARIVIDAGLSAPGDGEPHAAGEPAPASRGSAPRARPLEGALTDLGSPLNGRFTFREFVVGETNELAHAAAQQVAGVDHLPFNPLYLYGGVGLGKTHLLHSIAWCIRGREPGRRVLYLSAERFMYQFVQAIRQKDTVAFKERFRSADVLLIDDIQFICDKESTQEEFLHTLNALVDHRSQVVVSGDRSPSRLDGMEERLRSRLAGGLAVDIHPASYELRLGILREKAAPLGIADAPPEVMEFLAREITSNVRELEMALNRIAAHAALLGGAITLQTTQAVLRDVLVAKERRITIEEIQRRVAAHYNIKPAELSSSRRAQAVVRPRHVAMYLAKQLTSRSLPEIGRKFGKRDHTTVMYAIRRIEELRPRDAALDEDVEFLWRSLEDPTG